LYKNKDKEETETSSESYNSDEEIENMDKFKLFNIKEFEDEK